MLLKQFTLITILAGLGVGGSGAIACAQFWGSPSSHPMSRSQGNNPHPGMMQSGMMQPGMMQPGMMDHGQIQSEFDFLSQMIPHHQEAIDTAQIILERSTRQEIRTFAEDIIEVQSAEIEQMQAWLAEWYPDQTSSLTYTPMMRDLSQLEGDALDQTFLQDMIHHHHMAVMMAHQVVNHGWIEHEAVRPFAEQIASTQMAEIHQMHTWLQDWFGMTGMMQGRHRMHHF